MVLTRECITNGRFQSAKAEFEPVRVMHKRARKIILFHISIAGNSFEMWSTRVGESQKFGRLIKGFTGSIGATHVDSVFSGYSQAVKLPAYTLVNLGLHYERDSWKYGLSVKNLTDEQYFRSNFPDLFGSSVVLPELPRNYLFEVGYKF